LLTYRDVIMYELYYLIEDCFCCLFQRWKRKTKHLEKNFAAKIPSLSLSLYCKLVKVQTLCILCNNWCLFGLKIWSQVGSLASVYTASVEFPCPNKIHSFIHNDGDRKMELLSLSLRYLPTISLYWRSPFALLISVIGSFYGLHFYTNLQIKVYHRVCQELWMNLGKQCKIINLRHF